MTAQWNLERDGLVIRRVIVHFEGIRWSICSQEIIPKERGRIHSACIMFAMVVGEPLGHGLSSISEPLNQIFPHYPTLFIGSSVRKSA